MLRKQECQYEVNYLLLDIPWSPERFQATRGESVARIRKSSLTAQGLAKTSRRSHSLAGEAPHLYRANEHG